jgi:flagellar hook-length control protein FliK
MDPLAALPVPAAPVTSAADAPKPRDARSGDAADAGSFDDALKQELATLAPDSDKPAAKESGAPDASTEPGDGAARVDPAAAADAAIAALIGDAAAQPLPNAIVAQAVAAPASDAAKTPAGETDAETTIAAASGGGGRRGFEGTAAERGLPGRRNIERGVAGERATADRGAVDRATLDRAAVASTAAERSSVERGALERTATERTTREPGEVRDAAGVRGSHDLPGSARDKAAADTPTAAFLAALGAERNAAAEAATAVAPALAALDSLTAASLTAKWTAPGTGIFDPAPAPVTARVDTPLGTNGWGEAFQQKIVWLVDRQLGNAELHVNPPHLGPIEVMLNLSDEGTRIAFCSPHAAVREAIEASLPELRTALDERGLSLGQASVSADSSAAREQFSNHARDSGRQTHPGRPATGPVIAEPPMASSLRVQRGIVDLFA